MIIDVVDYTLDMKIDNQTLTLVALQNLQIFLICVKQIFSQHGRALGFDKDSKVVLPIVALWH